MTAGELLQDLRQRGVQLIADGDALAYRAARGVLTPESVEALRQHKAELLALLRAEDRCPRTGAEFTHRLAQNMRAVHGATWDKRVERFKGMGLMQRTAEECAFLALLAEEDADHA